MRASEFINEDMSRRGFLGALGAGAAAGAEAALGIKPPKEFNMLGNNSNNEMALQKTAYSSGLRGPELAQFLAQMKHESWNFERLKEKPQPGVKDYYNKKYDIRYSPKTAKILGNKHPGDGQKYHGRGFIQLTGKDNYTKCGAAIGKDLDMDPDFLTTPEGALKSALWFWNAHNLSSLADTDDVLHMTKKINGGTIGLEERTALYHKAKEVLSAE